MSVTLKDEKLLDSWGVVIDSAANQGSKLIDLIIARLKYSRLPGVEWDNVDASPGMLKGWMGKKREFLRVTAENLKDYRMYVGARDFGSHLDFSWFLTVEPGFFKKSFSSALTGGDNSLALTFNLDLFDQQDLRAYVTGVHRCCVREAIQQLVSELGQNTTGFDWQSKGFLKVW